MAKIISEAVQDPESGKWGFYIDHELDGRLLEPIYLFDTQGAAEEELIAALRELGGMTE